MRDVVSALDVRGGVRSSNRIDAMSGQLWIAVVVCVDTLVFTVHGALHVASCMRAMIRQYTGSFVPYRPIDPSTRGCQLGEPPS